MDNLIDLLATASELLVLFVKGVLGIGIGRVILVYFGEL